LSLLLPTPTPSPISTLSLHDALPICPGSMARSWLLRRFLQPTTTNPHRLRMATAAATTTGERLGHILIEEGLLTREQLGQALAEDRKSTRLNSSHVKISYAVFCLKKK